MKSQKYILSLVVVAAMICGVTANARSLSESYRQQEQATVLQTIKVRALATLGYPATATEAFDFEINDSDLCTKHVYFRAKSGGPVLYAQVRYGRCIGY